MKKTFKVFKGEGTFHKGVYFITNFPMSFHKEVTQKHIRELKNSIIGAGDEIRTRGFLRN
ncbi:MAG: hypothetical protein PWQ49_161 [Methanohalophilus sp.]|nr:hypothetical protein [Methanohalophilus sp.]